MARNDDSYYRQLDLIRSMVTPPDYMGQAQRRLAAYQPPQSGVGLMQQMPPVGGSSGSEFQRFIGALTGQESNRNYSAVNRSSGALGAYQILKGNLPSWSKEALGYVVSAQTFLNNPKIQDSIAQYKLRQYVNRYGYQGAAAAWYGGPGVARNWASRTNPQGAYPSIAAYVAQVMRRMGK